MRYVDGLVIAVPKNNLKAYVQMAQKAQDLEGRRCAGIS